MLTQSESGGRAACWPGLALTGLVVNKGDIVCLLPYEVMIRKYE